MTESPEESVASDLPTVAEDHEATIEVFQAKIDKLKSLLVKAKASINEYKHKADEIEEKLEEEQRRTEALKGKIDLLENKPPPANHEIVSVLARVKVDGVIWILVRTVNSSAEWFLEEQVKVASLMLPEVLDDSCVRSSVDAQVSNVVKQYESRLLRMQEAAEGNEEALKTVQKSYKDLQQAYKEKELQIRNAGELLHIVSESKSLHGQLSSLIEDDELKPDGLAQLQQAMIRFIQSPAKQNQETETVKEHIVGLHKTLLDLTRRLLHSRKEQQAQETAWRATCDALVNEKEELKGSLGRVRTDLSKKLEEHERTLSFLTETHESTVQALHREVERLTKEAKRAVNVPYLRHVVVQYLTICEQDVRTI